MTFLITGGGGFIGSHLADALVARGHEVTIFDDFSTGQYANIEHLVASGAAQVIDGSVTDRELVEDAIAHCDSCLHLAAAVGVKLIVSNALETMRRNVMGSDAVISATSRNCKPLLFVSTSEVYGKNSGDALDEDSDRVLGSSLKSRWSYAIAKSFGEALAHSYYRERDAANTIVRLFNTIGPRQSGAYGMVVPRLVRQALAGEDLTVYGDGTQSRCFLHVNDAVSAMLLLCAGKGSSGRAFNVGNTVPITIRALAERIILRAESASTISFVPYHDAYDEGFEELGKRVPDTTALREFIGWSTRHSLDQALDDVIAYQRIELAVETSGAAPEKAALLRATADVAV